MGRSLTRMGALPETNPKGEEIVDELKEGLKEFRENVKALAESISRPQTAPATLNRSQRMAVVGVGSIGVLAVVLIIGLSIKNVYDEFPNPLSPAQMSDLVVRLRKERPQRLKIIRRADQKSVALAEQVQKKF
jgi:hypothetical protein